MCSRLRQRTLPPHRNLRQQDIPGHHGAALRPNAMHILAARQPNISRRPEKINPTRTAISSPSNRHFRRIPRSAVMWRCSRRYLRPAAAATTTRSNCPTHRSLTSPRKARRHRVDTRSQEDAAGWPMASVKVASMNLWRERGGHARTDLGHTTHRSIERPYALPDSGRPGGHHQGTCAAAAAGRPRICLRRTGRCPDSTQRHSGRWSIEGWRLRRRGPAAVRTVSSASHTGQQRGGAGVLLRRTAMLDVVQRLAARDRIGLS